MSAAKKRKRIAPASVSRFSGNRGHAAHDGPPSELIAAGSRLRRAVMKDRGREVDSLISNAELHDIWWQLLDRLSQEANRNVSPLHFFQEVLLILLRTEFPTRGSGAITRRRRLIATKLRKVLSVVETEESLASVDVTRFFTFPSDLRILPGLVPDETRRACIHACWGLHPKLSVTQLLEKLIEEAKRPVPKDEVQVGRKTLRRQLVEMNLTRCFRDELAMGEVEVRPILAALMGAVIDPDACDVKDIGNRQRQRRGAKRQRHAGQKP